MKLTLLLLALTLTACSSDEKDTQAMMGRHCPNLNGIYSSGGDEVRLETKIDDDKYSYNFGDGMVWLEADGDGLRFDDANGLRATCGTNSVTLHLLQNGHETQTTFADAGGNSIEVSSGGSSRILPRTGDIPKKADPDHPDQAKICPVFNGTYLSDDGKLTLTIETSTNEDLMGQHGVYGYKINQFNEYYLGFTRGRHYELAENPGIIAYFTLDCSAGENGERKTLDFYAYDEVKKPEIRLHATDLGDGTIDAEYNGVKTKLHHK